ncbi:MAG: ABC-F family ATP-binding cassette domain-containing protein [Clostridia bacterium]|nr:ABC-F family ATP-binding cassette domain-containing protein [Clostridia bacterium]
MLVTLDGVAFGYGDNLIFEKVSFALNEGERVGLIGANGEGKTTLIKLILGELEADAGQIARKNGLKVGYLEQNGGYESGNSVYSEMLEIFSQELNAVEKLSVLSAELANAPFPSREYDVLSVKIESLNKFISAHDCFNVEVKIKTVLNGMGFSKMYDRVIDTLSGGEKTRLKLARLLLESPDLLILDEPTNHLDITTLFWLEEYLQTFKGAILVVSHDRYFLDKTVSRILEIENKRLTSFAGNYSKYKVLKAERYQRLLKEYEAQQEERAKLQYYVDRNIVRATTAKSAQSRVKQLERMEILEKPFTPPKPPSFKFEFSVSPYEQVLDIVGLNLERGSKKLISDGNISVRRGEKIAIVGENGTGKSTLLKEILHGNASIRVGRFVKIAYYDQESANLDGENTVLAELWERHVGYTQTEARSALARCGLFAEDMQKKVKSLSGGERAKLALCILECEHGNVLLLDEPTNHLDLPAREGLENALKKFDGTLIFVSHDRYFISALADKIAEIADGRLNYFDGGYESFNAEKKKLSEIKNNNQITKKKSFHRSGKERAEEERKKQQLKKLEARISELEQDEQRINDMLADPEIAADYIKVNELLKELEGIKLQLDKFYNEYGDML